jgi:hypothetical protein
MLYFDPSSLSTLTTSSSVMEHLKLFVARINIPKVLLFIKQLLVHVLIYIYIDRSLKPLSVDISGRSLCFCTSNTMNS